MSVRVLALSAFQSCAVLFSSPPPSRLLPCRAASSHARRASAAFGPGSRCSAPVSFHRGPHTTVPANNRYRLHILPKSQSEVTHNTV